MQMSELNVGQITSLFMPALTLAVLLSIDTLKTCVVLDSMTRSSHDSNRELTAQGIGNVASSCVGGMPGAGQMGATLVNLTSGGQTRLSGVFEGVFALLAFALLGSLIAWIPVAALAGILIVVGVRMIDYHSFRLLASPLTVYDFTIIAAVVITALTVSLIAASGIGIALTMLMYIREQLSSTVIHRKVYGNRLFARHRRSTVQMKRLEQRGDQSVILELQGSLFFGTKAQLFAALEPEFPKRTYFILDMRRVQGLDVSVAYLLTQIRDIVAEKNGVLIFSDLPQQLPSGRNIATFLEQMKITTDTTHVKVFPEIDNALVWVEDQLLGGSATQADGHDVQEPLLEVHEIDLFKGRRQSTLSALEACLEKEHFKAGEKIYSSGDNGNRLYLIRRGTVQILLPLTEITSHLQSTYGRGDFFGALSFLDGQPRSNIALVTADTDVFVLERASFDKLGDEHKKLALNLLEAIGRVLGARLRYDDMVLAELRN
jgi:SulP family sulfate permease